MKKYQLMASVFRTLQLTMIAMLALGVNNWVLWLTWSIAIAIDSGIDNAIRKDKHEQSA